MKFRILSALLRSTWAIDERFAIAHGGIVAGLLNGMEFQPADKPSEAANSAPFYVSENGEEIEASGLNTINPNTIAVIPIRGTLMKEDESDCEYFQAGMRTLSERVLEADRDPNVIGIILYIDSPGGTVDGTKAFSDAIKSCKKPVVAFVDGIMASGALWIGTSAQKVIAQNSTTEIGSIGVMVAFADMQPVWEAEGVKFHRINADQSKDKNKNFTDALAGDYAGIKKEELNPLADQFITAVKANRPNISNSVFTGKVYFAEEALSLGLIDEIGSFETAVAAVSALAKTQQLNNSTTQQTSRHNKPTIQTMLVPTVSSLLQLEAIESTEDGVFISVENIQAIENKLLGNQQDIDAANKALNSEIERSATAADAAHLQINTAANLQLSAETTIKETLAALDEIHPTIAAAVDVTAKIEAIKTILSQKPAAAGIGIKSAKDPSPSDDGVDWATLNSLPHMQVD